MGGVSLVGSGGGEGRADIEGVGPGGAGELMEVEGGARGWEKRCLSRGGVVGVVGRWGLP